MEFLSKLGTLFENHPEVLTLFFIKKLRSAIAHEALWNTFESFMDSLQSIRSVPKFSVASFY